MRKKTFLFLIIITLFLSLVGCTINSKPKNTSSKNIISQTKKTPSNKNTKDNSNSIQKNIPLTNENIGIPVLYYHSINPNSSNEVIMTPELFKEHMTYLKNEHYNTITLKELSDYLTQNKSIPQKSILITFDDGYMDNYIYAFPILKELNMKATIFCVASNLDGNYYLSEDAIKTMLKYGIDIESHTVTHVDLSTLSYENQLKEMKNSKKVLEDITNTTLTAIAYPFGNYNSDTIEAAKNSGFTFGFTTNKGLVYRNNNLLQLNRIYISSNYDTNTLKSLLDNSSK